MPITRVQRKVECPFCENEFLTGGIASHFKVCNKTPKNISTEERRKIYLKHNYPVDIDKLIEQYNNGASLPEISKTFGNMSFSVIQELLKFHRY